MEIRARGKMNFAILCILLLMVNMFQGIKVSAKESESNNLNLALADVVTYSDVGDGIETTDINLALGKPVFESGHDGSFVKENLVDGSAGTRWASNSGNTPEVYASWIYIDLGQQYRFNKIEVALERYPTEYKLMVSDDAEKWTEIATKVQVDSANYAAGGTDTFALETPVTARYVKFQGVRTRLNTDGTPNKWGYSLYELRVFQASLDDSGYIAIAKQNVTVPERVSSPFTLPLADQNGVSIAWTSNSNAIAIDGGNAAVTRGEQDQAVTLTAIFTKNNTSDTKVYPVVVRGKTQGKYVFYPEVHRYAYGEDVMQLAGKTINLVMEDDVNEHTAAKAQSIFEERGFTVTKVGQTASVDDIDVLIGIDNDKGADYEYLNGKFDPEVSVKKDDGYVLKISLSDRVIAIMGADNGGAFFGVTTLDQILEQAEGFLTDVLVEDYSDIKFRGFIEGFYGTPWSHENRKDLMAFGGDFKMNSYLYGPKDDPYHAAQWKEPYPPAKLAELKELVDKGMETNVEFVWAAHVGGKINLGSEDDIQALKNKFDQMYGIGVRQFAIFFDDSATNNDQLVSFITRIDSEYIKPKGDVKPIIFCPQYYRKDSGSQSTINYLQSISKFPKDVQIMWTGDNVVSPVKQSVVDWVTQYIDRPVYIWWNYPVNDLGRASYVHMGSSKGLYSGVNNISGFASNPMNQAQASKVSLFSVADYTWNTGEYDYEQSWQDSFDYIIPDNPKVANALRIFSQNASHGLNPFDTGESLYLLSQMNAFKQELASNEDISESGASLVRKFEEIIGAVDTLKAYPGTNGISKELTPWLDKMRKIAQASRNAVQGLMELGEISADDSASIQAAMTVISERRAELKTAVSASKIVAQKELVPFTEEILNLLETQLMENLSLPPKMRGFGSTTFDYTKMLDGNMTTASETDSGGVVSKGAYFGVNLGKSTYIDNVTIVMDNTKYYKKGVLEASVDNRTWTGIAEFDTSTVSEQGLDLTAQFLRYRATDEFTDEKTGSPNRGLSVKEFQVNVEQPAAIYTNVSALENQVLTLTGESAALKKVAAITLKPGNYVGFQFNKLKNTHSLKMDEALKTLTAEFSADGMNWSVMPWSDSHIIAAKYIRVSNTSQEVRSFALAELSVKFGGSPTLLATAHNVSIYEGNAGNMVDGNPSTYLWLRPSPNGDRNFIFDLGSEIPIYEMLIHSDKDMVTSGKIEFSSDGKTWRDPIAFSNAGNINTIDCKGTLGRYVKLTDSKQNQWLKVHEVEINKNVKENTFVLSGNLSGLEKLLDQDLFSYVDVGKSAGELTYNNINTPNATNLILMKNEGSEVKLMVKKASQDAAEWIEVGKFANGYQNIDLRAYVPFNEIQLKWEANSGLRINELFVATGKVTEENTNLALEKPVTYSGVEGGKVGGNWRYPQFVGEMAVDGDAGTRWSADKIDNQWLIVDLGEVQDVSEIIINFHAVSPDYEVFTSIDGNAYESVYKEISNKQGVKEIRTIVFDQKPVRYIKYQQNKLWKHTNNQYYGSSIYELESYQYEHFTANNVLKAAEEQQPTLSKDGKRLVLPKVSGDFKISLYGSDTQEVIAMDGTVHQPLVAMDVNLLYKVENINDPSDFATSEKDINIVVPGQYTQESGDNPVPKVLPGLREWKGSTGSFTLTGSSRIVVADSSLNDAAQSIQMYFKNMLNKDIAISDGEAQPGDIVLTLNNAQAILGEEGYTLDINDKIIIASSTAKGALYGGISITQILYRDKDHASVPKGLARDYPKYEVRSGMIDVGRMYIPLEYLQEMTIYMAWFKLNEVQIHVNDYWGASGYSAFRLESEKYPQIVAKDGYYSKKDYKQYQIEMKQYGIDVITEIDTPYHSEAFRGVPGVKMLGAGSLDIRDENTVNFVLDLLDEYLEGEDPVIQSNKFHIGTDEYDKAYSEQMRAYTDKLIKHVNGKGYETRLWGSLGTKGFNGKTPVTNEATMNLWAPYWSDVKETYAAGYDIINTVGGWLYIVPGSNAGYPDRMNLSNLYDNFDVNNFLPVRGAGNGTAIMPIAHPQTKGAEFAIWNDMTSFGGGFSQFDIFDRMRSAVAITAEKTWYGEKTEGQTAEQFVNRVETLYNAAGGANPGRYVPSDGDVIANYKFDELKSDFAEDSSPNKYNAKVVNGILGEGSIGKGITLNGDGCISLPFDSIGFPNTVSFDINMSEIPENTELFSGKDGTLYANFKGTGKLGFKRGELGIAYEFLFDYELPVSEWVNIALVQELTYRTGASDSNISKTKLYVNREYVGEAVSIAAPKNGKRYSSSFVLPTEKVMDKAKGSIDNLVIYNRTLAGGELDLRENLALSKPATTSSVYPNRPWTGDKAVDGNDDNPDSRWGSKRATGNGSNEDEGENGTKEQWIAIDLGENYNLSEVYISWEAAYAKVFKLQGSLDGIEYFDMKEITGFIGGKITIRDIEDQSVRYIRVYAMEPFNANYGYSIYEIKAYGEQVFDTVSTVMSGPSTIQPGGTFQLTYGVENADRPFTAQDIIIRYDSESLQYVGAQALAPSMYLVSEQETAPGILRLIMVSLGIDHAISGDQPSLLQLTFQAKDVPDHTNARIEVMQAVIGDTSGEEYDVEPSSHSIAVLRDNKPGDVNGDDKISIGDLAMIAVHYGKSKESADWELVKKFDVVQDEVIDILDLSFIARLLLNP